MSDPVTVSVLATLAQKEAAPADDEPTFTLVSVTDDVDRTKLPASPKKTLKTVTALGWDVLALRQTITHHPAVLMQSDGKTGLKGDVKTPERDMEHIFLVAADGTRQIHFEASWLDHKFEDAIVRDPLGIPVELFVDYAPSVERKKTLGVEYAMLQGEHRDYDYNDGVSYLAKTHYMKTSTEFNAWLNDWLAIRERNNK